MSEPLTPYVAAPPPSWRDERDPNPQLPLGGEAPDALGTLRQYWWMLQKRRNTILACFATTFGLALLGTLLMPRQYTATAKLQMGRQAPIQPRLTDNVVSREQASGGASNLVPTQVAVLQSRDLGQHVIRAQHLAENATFLDPKAHRHDRLVIDGSILPFLLPRSWEGEITASPDPDKTLGPAGDPELLERYMRALSVEDIHGTDLVQVHFSTPSPSLSAFLVAAHVQAYLEADDQVRRATDATAKEFLGRQLRDAAAQVERAELAFRQFATEHPNVAINEEQSTSTQRVTEVSNLLTKAEATRIGLQSRHQFLITPDADPQSYLLDRPGIQKLRLALLDVQSAEAGLAQRLGPNHPDMLELARHRKEIERQLQSEVRQEVNGVRSQFRAAEAREQELRQQLNRLTDASVALRELGGQYQTRKADLDSRRALHASLLKQEMETAVSSDLTASSVRVVERPEIPQRPSHPNLPLNLTLGLLAGLVLGIGAGFVHEQFDSSMKSGQEIQDLLQVRLLATIPNFSIDDEIAANAATRYAQVRAQNGNGQYSNQLVVLQQPRSRVAEAFRALRTAVVFVSSDPGPRVIAVTSACAGEGKTVNSVNLALALSQLGSRVLLIDADLHHRGCHRLLGIKSDCGLSSVLEARASLEKAYCEVPGSQLIFLPAGPTPEHPAELIGSRTMRFILDQARERFEYIIIDTPPLLSVTDGEILARAADGVVLVVRGQDTPRDQVRMARDRLRLAGAHLLGVVVNDVDVSWGDFQLYGPGYGVGNGAASVVG